MRALAAPLLLVSARMRRRPGRWVLPALGIALAAAFAVAVAAEAVIAADQSARASLRGLTPLDRTVSVTWQGPASPAVARRARRLLSGLGLGPETQVVLLNPVRLSGVVVRPAAIAPLGRWLPGAAATSLGPCRAADCPMLLAGGAQVPGRLDAIGVRIRVVGSSPLRSPVPLTFTPTAGVPAVIVTSDTGGLDALRGLSGVYRTSSWLALVDTARLHSWQLTGLEARLTRVQAALTVSGGQFSLSAPFDGLDAARAQAAAVPRRLLLAGGGAVAALLLFVVLAAGALRRDQAAELERLQGAGARAGQCALFVAGESGWLCAAALVAGAGLGLAAAALIAHDAGEPVGRVLAHSAITPAGALALAGGWVMATAVMTLSVLVRGPRIVDALAVAALSALAAGLLVGAGDNDELAVMLAPLCCLAAGVVTFRAGAAALGWLERPVRRAPVLPRLALVSLAREPSLPALAIAFLAVSIGLGGFALAYRATLLRGAADQAADSVPLDALVSPSPQFTTPLELAPLSRWQAIAGGTVLPVRRTEANYTTGSGTVTIPALGVPADGLALIHGWRSSDGSAPLAVLARRLRPPAPVRTPGPELPAGTRSLALRVSSPDLGVVVTAEIRDPQGAVTQLPLGTASERPGFLRARVPPGRWELEAFELDEPTGLEATNGHQNAENPAAETLSQVPVALGPALALRGGRPPALRGGPPLTLTLADWRAVGAASSSRAQKAHGPAMVSFATTGEPGIVRPVQPSDTRPVPILADPQTAAAAGPGGRIALTVDGLPVLARVVGRLTRFPTLPADASGFVVADQATLSSALDAQLPGQGATDELWIASRHLGPLRAALAGGPLTQLGASFRVDIERGLRTAPVARAVLTTEVAAAGLAAALAVLGLLTTLLGGGRDRRIERDLEAQGLGPRGLRAELRMRLAVASVLGVCVGLAIAVLLTLLAVATVRAAGTVAMPRPALVTVFPWEQLIAWGAGALAILVLAGWLATRTLFGGGRAGRPAGAPATKSGRAVSEGAVR